jgi:hypothetical protein
MRDKLLLIYRYFGLGKVKMCLNEIYICVCKVNGKLS